jgi:hypothetical protein
MIEMRSNLKTTGLLRFFIVSLVLSPTSIFGQLVFYVICEPKSIYLEISVVDRCATSVPA